MLELSQNGLVVRKRTIACQIRGTFGAGYKRYRRGIRFRGRFASALIFLQMLGSDPLQRRAVAMESNRALFSDANSSMTLFGSAPDCAK
jgi:hypothetical protein